MSIITSQHYYDYLYIEISTCRGLTLSTTKPNVTGNGWSEILPTRGRGPIDWRPVRKASTNYSFFRCHEMNETDLADLPSFQARFFFPLKGMFRSEWRACSSPVTRRSFSWMAEGRAGELACPVRYAVSACCSGRRSWFWLLRARSDWGIFHTPVQATTERGAAHRELQTTETEHKAGSSIARTSSPQIVGAYNERRKTCAPAQPQTNKRQTNTPHPIPTPPAESKANSRNSKRSK